MLWWQQSSNNVSSKMWNGSWGFLGIKSDRRCPAGSEGAAWRHQKSGSLFRQQANHRYVHILEQVLTSGRRLKSKQTNKIEQRYACKNMCPKWKVVWCEQNLVVFLFVCFFGVGGILLVSFYKVWFPEKTGKRCIFLCPVVCFDAMNTMGISWVFRIGHNCLGTQRYFWVCISGILLFLGARGNGDGTVQCSGWLKSWPVWASYFWKLCEKLY